MTEPEVCCHCLRAPDERGAVAILSTVAGRFETNLVCAGCLPARAYLLTPLARVVAVPARIRVEHSRLHAACCHPVMGGLCARQAAHQGEHDPRVAHEDGRTWTLQLVPPQ